MKTLPNLSTSLFIVGSVMSVPYTAQAADMFAENDAAVINRAEVSLNNAVNTALGQVPGKAVKAEFENRHGQGLWEIEIMTRKGVFDVEVDANNGSVLKQTADQSDHDGNAEKED